ncbi:type III polyketide synthase [Marinoscillum sp.]|uniref:type III polyketide synthase n=1 Tax=Marinoscillum sp. TaxID=2024838 RepID=UPI003BA8C758
MSSYISSIGTAVPDNRISQSDIGRFMTKHLGLKPEKEKLLTLLYRASGIQYRHSVIEDFGKDHEDFTFFPKSHHLEPFPKLGERMKKYEQEAIKLSMNAVQDCVGTGQPVGITHLITVSCTGMYAPGLDIELIEQLQLPTTTQRTSINFMGCYAAFNALKIADQIVKNNSEHKVLIVAVELCSIHVLKSDAEDSLLSNTLFGDGAAAVLVEDENPNKTQLAMAAFHADLAPSGKADMAWHIGDFGFEMKLSVQVPEVIRSGIASLTQKLLSKLSLNLSDIDYFAIHPGGKRILEVIEEELGVSRDQNGHAYEVMRNYGNMSSPTVLFVLQRLMKNISNQDEDKNILSFAFGPGLTLESMLLKIKTI